MSDDLPFALPDGTLCKTGCIQPDSLRFGAVPTWAEANSVLSEAECEDHDDLAPYCQPAKTQHYSNCTNASIAWGMKTALLAAGAESVPDLSMSYLYAFYNGGQDAGAQCRDVALGLMTKGLPPADLWPENQIYMPRGGVSDAVALAAQQFEGLEIYQCLGWADVRSALARRFVVYHGFVLGRAFFNAGRDGKVPAWDGAMMNGHAMVSRGLTRKFGDIRTITPNTWGPSFGENGVGYIDQSYFWTTRGNYVNLDAYAIRIPRMTQPLPAVA